MSTPNVPVYVRYIGNETTTEFSVTFPYIDKKYIQVYLARNRANTELLDETRYSFVNDTSIQFPIKDGDALLGYDDVLIILRKTDLGSDYDFDNQRRLFPEDVMNADDLAFQQIQELAYEVSRAIKVDITGEKTPDDLINSLHESERRTEQYAAQAEESKLSAEQFANDAEAGANIANSSAAKAQESALEAMSAKEYAEQAVMNENLITVANDLDSQDSNIKKVADNMQSVKDAIISAEQAAQSATEAEISAEQARQYAEQAAQGGNAQQIVNDNIGRLNQIGYYGTLQGNILTFEKPAEEEEYELKKGFTYLVDLLFEAVGELDDNIKIVIKNGDHNVNIVNVIHDKPSEPITVGEIKQIMKYSTDLGWRWLFNAWYTETQAGDRVLVMPSTVVSGLPVKIKNTIVSSGEWMPSSLYPDFGYVVMIHIEGVKETHAPTVVFDVVEAVSGNFAPVAISEDDAVTIFAKEKPTSDINIPLIILE